MTARQAFAAVAQPKHLLMLEHADIKQTQRWLNITDEELWKAVTGVWDGDLAVENHGADLVNHVSATDSSYQAPQSACKAPGAGVRSSPRTA